MYVFFFSSFSSFIIIINFSLEKILILGVIVYPTWMHNRYIRNEHIPKIKILNSVHKPLPPHDVLMQICSLCSVLVSCWLLSIRGHISSLRMMNTLTLLLAALSLPCEFSCSSLFVLLSDINWWSVSEKTSQMTVWLVVPLSFHPIRFFRSEYGVHSFQFSSEKAWRDSQSLLQRIWLHIQLLHYELDQTIWGKSSGMDRRGLL